MKTQYCQKEIGSQPRTSANRSMLAAFLTVATLCAALLNTPSASAKEVQRLPHEPNNPKILQVYFNTTDNHEYIYNGQEWVPHDASIDTYVLKKYQKAKVPKQPAAGNNGSNNNGNPSHTQGVSK